MAAGLQRLKKIQLGVEAALTPGTAVAATSHWRGQGQLLDNLEVAFPAEDTGQMMGMARSYIKKRIAAFTLAEVEATFEQLCYPLSASLANVVAGAADGAGSGYIYTYPFPTDSRPTFRVYTMRGGDDQAAEVVEYAFCEKFTISGEGEGAVMMSSDWVGRQATPGAFTGAVSFPTVEEILFGNCILMIDDTDTYPAETTVVDQFVSFELAAEELLKATFTGEGNGNVFSFPKPKQPKLSLNVTFEHDTIAIAEKANWRAGTERAIRIIGTGAALTTEGTAYANKTLIIDAVGVWSKFTGLEDKDGNNQVTGTLDIHYSPTAATAGRIIVVNELAALP